MSASNPPKDGAGAVNRTSKPVEIAPKPSPRLEAAPAPSSAPAPQQPAAIDSKAPVSAPAWRASGPSRPDSMPTFNEYSPATAEILNRLRSNPGASLGTLAFEAKRAEVLQNYVTSDKLPTPPPIANNARRGRGGRIGTPSQLKKDVSASPATAPTPTAARGSGRGRGRGRGRRGGRGGKRKRSESADDSDNDSDISSSYTPLPTQTKSGRNVNKPVAFVPTLPEPSPAVKRRRSTKTILAAQCKVCHRGTDPGNNRIVFCDVCTTAYHQYCHNPPIENEVVNVLEKEWLCGPCQRSKQNVVEGTEDLVSGEGLSIDEKKAYLSTLSQPQLLSLVLHATIRHPELPIFPSNIETLITKLPKVTSTSNTNAATTKPVQQAPSESRYIQQLNTSTTPAANPTQNGLPTPSKPTNNNNSRPPPPSNSQNSTSPDLDPAEAQLLGEIPNQPKSAAPKPTMPLPWYGAPNPLPATTVDNAHLFTLPKTPTNEEEDYEEDDDPPAHYPKPGNGLARTMRPESEDLQWLVDDNFEVFSHHHHTPFKIGDDDVDDEIDVDGM